MFVRLSLIFAVWSAAACGAAESPPPAGPAAAAGPAATVASTAGQPGADPVRLGVYRTRIERELRSDILPFWLAHARDREHGGFFGEISRDLTVKKNAPRGALIPARVLWTYSAAYRRYGDPAYLEMARWAYDDLLKHFWDKNDGGLYWSITADGQPLETEKELYIQSFGIYGLSEYYRASGDPAALKQAIELYRLVETHCRDRTHGGYFEGFKRDWTLQTKLSRTHMNAMGLKSQNTHLHLMEAYTNLLRAWPDPELRGNLHDLVEVVMTRILNPANHHLWLFLDADWKPRTDVISFGHDIELSWLLPESAEVLGDPALVVRARAAALATARATLKEGVDADGGLLSEAGPRGLTNTTKEWWQQCEATTGFFNPFQLSGDARYLQASLHCWDFIETHMVDRKNGEWYRALNRNGSIPRYQPKVSFWKCPYHNGRVCMEMLDRIAAVLGTTAAPTAH